MPGLPRPATARPCSPPIIGSMCALTALLRFRRRAEARPHLRETCPCRKPDADILLENQPADQAPLRASRVLAGLFRLAAIIIGDRPAIRCARHRDERAALRRSGLCGGFKVCLGRWAGAGDIEIGQELTAESLAYYDSKVHQEFVPASQRDLVLEMAGDGHEKVLKKCEKRFLPI